MSVPTRSSPNPLRIGDRCVGSGEPCFIIAEAGVNHNGDPDAARQLVDAAVAAGADAVKFQTFRAERLAQLDAPKAEYQHHGTEHGETQYEMLKGLELSEEHQQELVAHCERSGILFLSSPFDEQSAEFLAELSIPALKIPSGELTNLSYLAHLAQLERPLIVSTGMARMNEVRAAVDVLEANGNPPYALLHCISDYPTAPEDVNLRAMATLECEFGVPVGFSDHTLGNVIAVAAVALGACIVEKHLTLDHTLPGPDHSFSSEPDEFRELVRGIRAVDVALGHGRKEPAASEAKIAQVVRKSVIALRPIPQGVVLDADMLSVRRPGTGLPPAMMRELVGRRTLVSIEKGTLLRLDMLE